MTALIIIGLAFILILVLISRKLAKMSAKLNKLQYKVDETYAVASLNKDRLDLMHNRFCREIWKAEQNITKTIKEQVQPPVRQRDKRGRFIKTKKEEQP